MRCLFLGGRRAGIDLDGRASRRNERAPRRLSKKSIAGYLVLHDAGELQTLHEDFVTSKELLPNKLEISMLNDYFGEQAGGRSGHSFEGV